MQDVYRFNIFSLKKCRVMKMAFENIAYIAFVV